MITSDSLPSGDGGSVCVAHASSSAWRECGKQVLAAFVSAFEQGCGATEVDDLVSTAYPFMKDAAEAIVKVRVHAFDTCNNAGTAFGCVEAGAFASSSATNLVSIVSSAVAQASGSCAACDRLATQAMASAITKLVVQAGGPVSAFVNASICVGPDSSAPAVAYSACASQVLAHKLAFAFAKAAVRGQCAQFDQDAAARVGSLARADKWCDCQGYAYVCDSNNACYVGKQDTPVRAHLDGFKKFPKIYDAFVAECADSTVSQQIATLQLQA